MNFLEIESIHEEGSHRNYSFTDRSQLKFSPSEASYYKHTKTYYANQLIANFFNKHETIARIPSSGIIELETKPNLVLRVGEVKIGRKLKIMCSYPDK
jgi:hypothetical protein